MGKIYGEIYRRDDGDWQASIIDVDSNTIRREVFMTLWGAKSWVRRIGKKWRKEEKISKHVRRIEL